MRVNTFLDIDGIKGEAQDSGQKDKIEVLAWSWGVSNAGTLHTGSGGGAGKANFHDLSITKHVDAASADLMAACASGKHIPKAKLICYKAAGDKPLDYLLIELEEVLVSAVSTGGSNGESQLTENVSLNFTKITLKYKKQDAKGAGTPAGTFTWNVAQNKK